MHYNTAKHNNDNCQYARSNNIDKFIPIMACNMTYMAENTVAIV